jgi:type II secretory pathway component PulC
MAAKIFLTASIVLNLVFAVYILFLSSPQNDSWANMSSQDKKRACVSYAKEKVQEFADNNTTDSNSSTDPRKPLEEYADAPVEKIELSKKEIKEYTSNLPKVLRDAKAVPYVEPGTRSISGFKVVSIKTGSVYERLGIQQQDIIKGFNGKEIVTPRHAMQLYQNLKTSGSMKLHILREGKPKTLHYQIN